MTPTVQEVAEQIVRKDALIHYGGGNHPKSEYCLNCLRDTIADALTTFAQARERAVWEEAAKLTDARKEPLTSRANEWSCRMYWLAGEFRRRATSAKEE